MSNDYTYTCPNCSKDCHVPSSLAGQNVICPTCSKEFFATPPVEQPMPIAQAAQGDFVLPEKLPFFKSGRRKILEQRIDQLLATESLNGSEEVLFKLAANLGLQQDDVVKICRDRLTEEFAPIRKRMESSFLLTDEDLELISQLKKKYCANLTLEGDAELFRAIYLLETKGELPAAIQTDLMLKSDELVYWQVQTTWYQSRVHNRGYAGTSVSIPSGIKGVRFRFGSYSPVRSEEITPLANGVLYVTSERLLFNGNERNTAIGLKKVIDGHVFADSVKIEKSAGKPDYFSMNPAQARYILSLVGVLK